MLGVGVLGAPAERRRGHGRGPRGGWGARGGYGRGGARLQALCEDGVDLLEVNALEVVLAAVVVRGGLVRLGLGLGLG